jgi:hypothetical protein
MKIVVVDDDDDEKCIKRKGEGKLRPRTGHEVPQGEYRYSSILSANSTLEEGGWSTPPRPFYPRGQTRYPLYRRLGGPQERSGRVWKIPPMTNAYKNQYNGLDSNPRPQQQ